MPIRFRCAYCNQLLGIARRKAGTVVRCPGCSGQVVVPTLEEAGAGGGEPPPSPPSPPAPPSPGAVKAGPGTATAPAPAPVPQVNVFEGDIDRMLEGADQPSVIQPGPMLPSAFIAAAPVGASGRPPGIWLSPARATLLSVSAVIALAIAFGSGLVVGLLLARP